MLTNDDLPDPWSYVIQKKPHPNGFNYSSQLVKTNVNQSIMTKKINPLFREKSHRGLLWSWRDSSRHRGLSESCHLVAIKTHCEEVQKVNYSIFPPGWTKLCSIYPGGGKFNLFSAGNGFTGQIFIRERIQLGDWDRVIRFKIFINSKGNTVVKITCDLYVVINSSSSSK